MRLFFLFNQSHSPSLFQVSVKALRNARKAQERGRDRRFIRWLSISPSSTCIERSFLILLQATVNELVTTLPATHRVRPRSVL